MNKLKITAALLCFVLAFTTACSELPAESPAGGDELLSTAEIHADDESEPVVTVPHLTESGEKIVGSREMRDFVFFSYFPYETLEEMVVGAYSHSGRIVIGQVDSVADVYRYYWHTPEDLPPLYNNVTDYNIVVRDTLYGEKSDSLILTMAGLPDCNNGLTKPNIGDTLLLFLWSGDESEEFGLMQWEDAMFKINDDGTLYSFSDNPMTARFDGLQLSALTDEIAVARERVETQFGITEGTPNPDVTEIAVTNVGENVATSAPQSPENNTEIVDSQRTEVTTNVLPPVAPPEPDDTHIREYLDRAITDAVNGTATRRAEHFAVYFSAFERSLNLSGLTEFYFPNVRINGFELWWAEVTPAEIWYHYAPINPDEALLNDEGVYEWCHYSGILIRMARADVTDFYPLLGAPLREVMLELADYTPRPEGELKDGFLYLPGWNSIMGKLDGTRFEVRMPANLNDYDFLRDIAQQVIETAELVRVDVG
jgi:hypothetical protein